ncbi:hypothetical protein PACTADRAFT_31815 [Pachysolen tannophilus NRRL Y-2460]|uniref:Cytosolic endo-beta-N-acetylglucosaminidase TIM barrel domain-containing protein n=1 Tax=Pachysolen tannophilus NRRL Y-2460 TaxID=669874 RepID=A0A1E4U355_PACTA|nr:hypothetical protein PACTADRAFT_31815 [Pachysolen tannophilus NRRL Y-2460]
MSGKNQKVVNDPKGKQKFFNVNGDALSSIFFTNLKKAQEWYDNRKDNTTKTSALDKFRIAKDGLAAYERANTRDFMQLEYRPKLLICHDFKGGYQDKEDLNPLGYFPHATGQRYFLQFPSLIDDFVYFSHHRISVPPVSWINMCHRNGIRCLGTVIIEGNTAEALDECNDFVAKDSDRIHFKYIKILVELVKVYKFDGWLINIETRFSDKNLSYDIVKFIDSLKCELHLVNPDSKLIWYDAYVPALNRVQYFNGIADENYDLYRASDNLLTNYWWDQTHLTKNIELVGLKGAQENVYVGVDVWGRGMKFSNGGFETSIALSWIIKYISNCGIFAPAWTYEHFGSADFEKQDIKFWIGLTAQEMSINTFIQSQNSTVYKIPNTKNDFLFYSSFNEGQGKFFSENGKRIFNESWCNGNLQFEIPLICYRKQDQLNDSLRITKNIDDSFQSGSCLEVTQDVNLPLEDSSSLGATQFLIKNQLINRLIQQQKQAQPKPLFNICKECSSNLQVKVSYKYKDFPSGSLDPNSNYFQIIVKYFIERRVRSITRSKEGSLVLPIRLDSSDVKENKYNGGWKVVEKKFPLPSHSSVEHVMLESVNISFASSYTEEDDLRKLSAVSGNLGKEDEPLVDDEWVIVSSRSNGVISDNFSEKEDEEERKQEKKSFSLLIGDISVVSMQNPEQLKVNKVQKIAHIETFGSEDYAVIEWANENKESNIDKVEPLYWNIFVNDEFKGATVVPSWIIYKKELLKKQEKHQKVGNILNNLLKTNSINSDKVRIDTVTRVGEVTYGDDIPFIFGENI